MTSNPIVHELNFAASLGNAPFIVFDGADIEAAVKTDAEAKAASAAEP